MADVIIQLIQPDPSHPVDTIIHDVTGGPVHARIFLPIGPGFTCETTYWPSNPKANPAWWQLWRYKSGHRQSLGELPCDIRLGFKVPWTDAQVLEALRISLEKANSRRWYSFLLTITGVIWYPTRKFWAWIYRKTSWAPFFGPVMNCSADVDDIVARAYENLWPTMPESLTVPGDYLKCDKLQVLQ